SSPRKRFLPVSASLIPIPAAVNVNRSSRYHSVGAEAQRLFSCTHLCRAQRKHYIMFPQVGLQRSFRNEQIQDFQSFRGLFWE
ncbi:hypothetical protein GOODEAATRI_033086, partial [Goodea atripinnis]